MESNIYPRKVLGLDVSTACIGVCVLLDKGEGVPEILSLTHVSPKIPNKIKGIEALFLRKKIFDEEFLPTLKDSGITDIVIEEPLLSSNNVNTVATLLRFNGMISESCYSYLGIVPNFISSYDAREFSFPELVSLRKYNKRGEEYSLKHVKDAIKKDNIVLFGGYPFDVDKKVVMMNMVNNLYDNIEWVYKKNQIDLKKENYDACDALVCTLAYININRNGGIEKPTIVCCDIAEKENEYIINYTTKLWNQEYKKKMTLSKNDITNS